jgi:predicted RNA-binding protein
MCQVSVVLNDEVIMQDVMLVEPVPEGVRLVALFEPVRVIPAAIRQVDLMKNQVILAPLQESETSHERDRETARAHSALDRAQPGAR